MQYSGFPARNENNSIFIARSKKHCLEKPSLCEAFSMRVKINTNISKTILTVWFGTPAHRTLNIGLKIYWPHAIIVKAWIST